VSNELELASVPGGTRLRLRVKPGARTTAIVGVHGGALKLSIAAAPEKGKANQAVVRLLAEVLGLPVGAVRITAGAASQDKVAEIAMSPDVVRARLDRTESSRAD